jgi:hypothetical protein
VKENYHIKQPYHNSNWLCCPVTTTTTTMMTTTTLIMEEFIKVLSQTNCKNLLFEQAFVAHSHSGVNNIRRYCQYTVPRLGGC